MLSIGAIGGSDKAHLYYTKYCQEAGEAPGKWVGEAKEQLGLSGVVEPDTMKALLGGFDGRKGGKTELGNPLVKNAGSEDRRGGFDLTFSAPKSVSCVWSVSDESTRDAIEKAVLKAAEDALSYMQKYEGFSRTGKDGVEQIKAKLIGSMFLHSSNREGEPNLHTHLVLKNLGFCEDGVWRTLDGRGIFKSKMTAGNIFKASLAESLQKLGFSVAQNKDSFEVKGVSQEVRDKMSSRSHQIEKYLMDKFGLTRSQASSELLSQAALNTRQSKDAVENRRDFNKWQEELSKFGFTANSVEKLKTGKQEDVKVTKSVKDQALNRALKSLTVRNSTFTQRQLHSAYVKELIGLASTAQIDVALEDVFNSKAIIKLAHDKFTSIDVMKMERDLVRSLIKRETEGGHRVSSDALRLLSESYPTLTNEQWNVINHVCNTDSSVSVVRGYAGAGKSFTMGAVAEAFREDGYNIIGLAPSNKAKIGLGESIKGPAHTLDSMSFRLKKGINQLTSKDILVVDEAAMASSVKLKPIIREANKVGAKLVFVGDEKQLQPIEAGQLFKTLYEKIGGTEITEVYRQERLSEAQAILKVRDGEVLDTLRYYSGRRGVDFDKFDNETAFNKFLGLQNDTDKLTSHVPVMFTSKGDSEIINKEYREFLIKRGAIKDEGVQINGKNYARGDQILFTGFDRKLEVSQGETAKILSASDNKIVVRNQAGKNVEIDPSKFSHFTHGYVMARDKFKDERGLHISPDTLKMREKLIKDWADYTVANPGKSSLIIASTNHSVRDLNERARIFAQEHEIVKDVREITLKSNFKKSSFSLKKKEHTKISLGIGDQVVLTKTNNKKGYAKNDIATVIGFEEDGKIQLKVGDREFSFDPKIHDHISYGYAVTAHKSQGDTVDKAFVAVDSKFFDQNIFYVAISRGRNAGKIYTSNDFLGRLSDKEVAYLKALKPEKARAEYFGLYREKLANAIKGSSEKDTTQDYFSKSRIETRTKAEVLTDAIRKMERVLKPVEQKLKEISKKRNKKKKNRGMRIF